MKLLMHRIAIAMGLISLVLILAIGPNLGLLLSSGPWYISIILLGSQWMRPDGNEHIWRQPFDLPGFAHFTPDLCWEVLLIGPVFTHTNCQNTKEVRSIHTQIWFHSKSWEAAKIPIFLGFAVLQRQVTKYEFGWHKQGLLGASGWYL